MPGYRRGFSRNRGALSLRPVNSIKNVFNFTAGLSGTVGSSTFAKAVTSPNPTVTNDVSHGCTIKAVYVVIDACGLAGTGVLNVFDAYILKNPGANLSGPNPISQGSSNEKKFIIKSWRAMIMRNQDGNVPYHWEGWVKLPRRYHRMGTDDTWSFVFQYTTAVTGHVSGQFIYKWFS